LMLKEYELLGIKVEEKEVVAEDSAEEEEEKEVEMENLMPE
jgi:hypothetical protein